MILLVTWRSNMFNKTLAVLLLVLVTAVNSWALEVGGVDLPDNYVINEETVILNGAGIREKFAFRKDIYVAALYLPEKNSDSQVIIDADEPMSIRLNIVTGLIKAKDFIESTRAAFEESTGNNTAPIQNEIENFISVFQSGIEKHDIYDIVYHPETGIAVYKNLEKEPVVVIEGFAIKKALFGIWIGERSEDFLMELRSDMLGL